MERIYFTITGTSHYFGSEFFKPDQEVRLVKEPDNKVDREAIRVELPGLGTVGYVANSPHTVLGESYSAGRLYDRIGDTAKGFVVYRLDRGVLCSLTREKQSCVRSTGAAEPHPCFLCCAATAPFPAWE